MRRNLTEDLLKKILQYEDISNLDIDDIRRTFIEEEGIEAFAPDGFSQMDPRNSDRIVYNSARARRPHDRGQK